MEIWETKGGLSLKLLGPGARAVSEGWYQLMLPRPNPGGKLAVAGSAGFCAVDSDDCACIRF